MDERIRIKIISAERFASAGPCASGSLFETFTDPVNLVPTDSELPSRAEEYFQTKRRTPSLSSDEAVAM